MVGLHHQLDGHEFEQAPGVGDRREAQCAAVHGVAKSRTPAPLLFGVRLFIPTPQTWWSGTLVLTLIGRG